MKEPTKKDLEKAIEMMRGTTQKAEDMRWFDLKRGDVIGIEELLKRNPQLKKELTPPSNQNQ